MNEQANRLQTAINTLQTLEIKSTYNNMDRLMGVIYVLSEVRDQLRKSEPEVQLELVENEEEDPKQ